MLRPIPRLLRSPPSRFLLSKNTAPRRYIGFARPSQQSRSWKNYAARWGIAIAGIYWYNTSDWFAGEAAAYKRLLEHQVEDDILPTIETIAAERRQRQDAALATAGTSRTAAVAADIEAPLPSTLQSTAASAPSSSAQIAARPAVVTGSADGPMPGSPDELEEEAAGEGAFNEETGEINWDCPCLGGMAHGPCGPEFREAFSCFVYSKEEPKGVDCIERFKTMQDCFRKHPDVYGAELSDDPEDDAEYQAATAARDGAPAEATPFDLAPADEQPQSSEPLVQVSNSNVTASSPPASATPAPAKPTAAEEQAKTARAKAAREQVEADHGVSRDTGSPHGPDGTPESDAAAKAKSETEEVVPKAWYDARGGDEGKK